MSRPCRVTGQGEDRRLATNFAVPRSFNLADPIWVNAIALVPAQRTTRHTAARAGPTRSRPHGATWLGKYTSFGDEWQAELKKIVGREVRLRQMPSKLLWRREDE